MKPYALLASYLLSTSPFHLASTLTTPFNATFDTLTPTLEEGPLTPIGTYLNISYPSFLLSSPPSPSTSTGLIPPSTPNYAYSSQPAAMTISYPGSQIQSFALASFYYGCVTSVPQAAAALPVPCTVTASGYRAGSTVAVAVQEFVFAPAAGWRVPLAFGGFEEGFGGLERVAFAQSLGAGTEFVVDSVVGSVAA